MKSIEIPYVKERSRRYRFFEMLPGLLTWGILALPFVLSLFIPIVAVLFVIAYLTLWFAKTVGLNVRALQGYRMITMQQKLPWNEMLADLKLGAVGKHTTRTPDWHLRTIARLQATPTPLPPKHIIHASIFPTYK